MLGSDSSTIVVIIRANERHRPIGSLNRLYTSLLPLIGGTEDRKSTRLNSSHSQISYAVFCLKKKTYVERGSGGFVSTGPPLFSKAACAGNQNNTRGPKPNATDPHLSVRNCTDSRGA